MQSGIVPLPAQGHSPEERTLSQYAAQAQLLASQYESGDRHRMQRIMSCLFPPRSNVLELGCGSGADAAILLEAGVAIIPSDGSQEMLAEAARLHPELAPLLKQIKLPGHLPFADHSLDGVITNTLFMHLSASALELTCAEIARILRPGRALFVTVISKRPDIDSAGFDSQGRYFNGVDLSQLQSIFKQHSVQLRFGYTVPDALGRKTVQVEEGVFKKESTKKVVVAWDQTKELGTFAKVPSRYPSLLEEFRQTALSERQIDRKPITPALDAVLFPTLGCFQPGYLLVTPTREMYSFGSLHETELQSVSTLVNRWRSALETLMGDVVVAEHGSSATCDKSAACVAQAHLHLIPLPGLRTQMQERYYEAGGKPDEVLNDLSQLPSVVADQPYVLLSTKAGEYEIWTDVERFSNQFVRRQAADLMGLSEFYNWRTFPFVEQMELSKTLLVPLFASLSQIDPAYVTDIRWGTPYEIPEYEGTVSDPHVMLFSERNVERLLFLANCRAQGVAEEAFDRLEELHIDGKLGEVVRVRAEAAANNAMRTYFSDCANRAALGLLVALGRAPDPLPDLYGSDQDDD